MLAALRDAACAPLAAPCTSTRLPAVRARVQLLSYHGYTGALLYELAAGVPPFGGGAAPPTVGARAVPPQLLLPLVPVARCSAELHDLLDALLEKQAGLRPSM